jgi:hypothetical protein
MECRCCACFVDLGLEVRTLVIHWSSHFLHCHKKNEIPIHTSAERGELFRRDDQWKKGCRFYASRNMMIDDPFGGGLSRTLTAGQ